jgi:hypothetical protein
MAASPQNDIIPNEAASGFSVDFDWKNSYVSSLNSDGYERFAQYSASPSSTALFAGPARFSGLSGDAAVLVPIGLTDGVQYQADAGLQRLFEIGSDRAFFTRGKTQHAISMGKMLADQNNILYALSVNAYRPTVDDGGYSAPGASSPDSGIMMNLDSEFFNVPFGLMMLFKTKGGGDGYGTPLTAIYLEYCMFQNYSFSVASQAPVIVENVMMQFDRPVPVSFNS